MLGRYYKTTVTAHFTDEVAMETVGGVLAAGVKRQDVSDTILYGATAHFAGAQSVEVGPIITGPVEEVEVSDDAWRKNGQIVYNPFTGQPL